MLSSGALSELVYDVVLQIRLRLRPRVEVTRRNLGLVTFSGGTRTMMLFSGWATIFRLCTVA